MDTSNSARRQGGRELLDYVEVTIGAEPTCSVIWLHGLGADGHDFEPVVPYLGLPTGMAVRFIFPHATPRPITINGGMVMRAWYDIVQISLARDQDEAGIMRSAEQVRALIAHEIARGIAASNIVLAGFSQGGALALHVGLRYEQRLAGIMALSAYLLFPGRLADERSPVNAQTPVFVGHGTMDPMVPLTLGEATAAALGEGDWPVEWHTYPVPHSVSQPEIEDVGRWLTARLGQVRQA
jgi:phospholipase/carboxylesterase